MSGRPDTGEPILTGRVNLLKLGIAYLVLVGTLFSGIGVYQLIRTLQSGSPEVITVLFIGTTSVLAASLIALGVWLYTNSLDDEHTLTVAKWTALGLSLPTIVVVIVALFQDGVVGGTGHLTGMLTTGAVVGALFGSITALQAENLRVTTLHQRNQVLQRVLRHNIRNGMNIVEGYAQMLEETRDGHQEDLLQKIRREARSIVDLADTTRSLDTIDARESEPIDLAEIVTKLVETLGHSYPETPIETEMPESAWARTDGSVEVALWHLLEFMIHRDSTASIVVSLARADNRVRITVTDAGNPISDEIVTALESEGEGPFANLEGMDLWIVKWLVESIDGTMTIHQEKPDGGAVELAFPAAKRGQAM